MGQSQTGVCLEWREVKADLGCFITPKGLKNLTQGFKPWELSSKAIRPEGAARDHYWWLDACY
jgi:hypothetical protein